MPKTWSVHELEKAALTQLVEKYGDWPQQIRCEGGINPEHPTQACAMYSAGDWWPVTVTTTGTEITTVVGRTPIPEPAENHW